MREGKRKEKGSYGGAEERGRRRGARVRLKRTTGGEDNAGETSSKRGFVQARLRIGEDDVGDDSSRRRPSHGAESILPSSSGAEFQATPSCFIQGEEKPPRIVRSRWEEVQILWGAEELQISRGEELMSALVKKRGASSSSAVVQAFAEVAARRLQVRRLEEKAHGRLLYLAEVAARRGHSSSPSPRDLEESVEARGKDRLPSFALNTVHAGFRQRRRTRGRWKTAGGGHEGRWPEEDAREMEDGRRRTRGKMARGGCEGGQAQIGEDGRWEEIGKRGVACEVTEIGKAAEAVINNFFSTVQLL